MTAPTRRAGKTRVLNMLNLLVAKPLKTVSVTPPALFRTVGMARLHCCSTNATPYLTTTPS